MIIVGLSMIVLGWVKVSSFFYFQRFGTKKVYRGIRNFKRRRGTVAPNGDTGLDIKSNTNSEIDLSKFEDGEGPDVSLAC